MADLYRKTSLERISSPEQLDKVIRIEAPVSWPVLAGITVILAAVLIWVAAGTLPVTMTAGGLVSARSVFCTLSPEEAEMLEPGMAAMIYPEGTDSRSGRYLLAEIVKIDIYEEAALPASGLPDSRRGAAVVCALPSGTILPEGTSVTVRFLLGDASPAEKLFPGLNARWRD